jgi:hypothetical protein
MWRAEWNDWLVVRERFVLKLGAMTEITGVASEGV